MKTYIGKPNTIHLSDFPKNEFALSPFNYRTVTSKNTNLKTVRSLLEAVSKGFEPGSDSYIGFSDNYFIRISELDDFGFTFDVSKDTKRIIPPDNSQAVASKKDILYQTASNVGNVCIYIGDKGTYFNSHLRKLAFKEDTCYIFAMLKSSFCKEQVDVLGSIKGVDNFREEYLLDTVIPFPSTKNHSEPEKVKELISLIVQNILDKEEQIKAKNNKIDELIEKELKGNQKDKKFKYKFPSISEIKQEGRFDTIPYGKKYKSLIHLVINYKNGIFYINEDNVAPGRTPPDYYFTDKKLKNTFEWVTPRNISKRQLLYKTYIHTENPPSTKKYSLIFSGIRYVGNCFFVESDSELIYCNQNTLIIDQSEKLYEQVFLLCYLSSEVGKQLQLMQRIVGIIPILYTDDFVKIPIPNFPKQKQQEITKKYYNPLPKNKDLNFENYLENEKARNNKIGIFQLNMEILNLREIMEDLVDRIINEEPIEFVLEY